MALIFWKRVEPPDPAGSNEPALPVDERHALPTNLYFSPDGSEEPEGVSSSNPLPARIVDQPVTFRTGQVSVATTATQIVGANSKRKSIKITNVTGTQVVYLGPNQLVSTGNGDYLHSVAGSNTSLSASDEIWGIAVTAAQTVSWMEDINA